MNPLQHSIAPDCPWRNPQAELETKLVGNAFFAPGGVLAVHLADQVTEVFRQARSAAFPRLPAPEGTECRPVPLEERLRFDDHQCSAPVKELRQRWQRNATGRADPPRPGPAFLKQRKLPAEEEILSQ